MDEWHFSLKFQWLLFWPLFFLYGIFYHIRIRASSSALANIVGISTFMHFPLCYPWELVKTGKRVWGDFWEWGFEYGFQHFPCCDSTRHLTIPKSWIYGRVKTKGLNFNDLRLFCVLYPHGLPSSASAPLKVTAQYDSNTTEYSNRNGFRGSVFAYEVSYALSGVSYSQGVKSAVKM